MTQAGQDLSGTLPGELGELIYIQSISLFWNNFVGPLPAVWASNKHLLNVELNFNFLTGTIPNEWFEANALQRINVGGNMLTGTLSPKIGNLGALKGFFPMENLMSGTIPSELASLKFLCKCVFLIEICMSHEQALMSASFLLYSLYAIVAKRVHRDHPDRVWTFAKVAGTLASP